MNNIENLINIVEIIKQKYEKFSKSNTNFNIFTILRNESDEVNLHSKFIVELLSNIPYYSDIFFKLFLKNMAIKEDYFPSKVKVLREYKNIDILIKSEDKNIIIENKIFAEDQYKQLERYYQTINGSCNDVKIFYLTLDGHSPSKNSLGKLLCSEDEIIEDRVIVSNLSYKNNISSWIEECIKESSRIPELRETLIQYLEVVNKLTGQTESKDFYEEVSSKLEESSKNLKIADDIRKSFDLAINRIKFKFWKELEQELMNNEIFNHFKENKENNNRYSPELINQNKKYYGLLYSILRLSETEELAFRFEIDHRLYYGFGMIINNQWIDVSNKEKYKNIKDIINAEVLSITDSMSFSSNQSSKWWLAYIYSTPNFNYRFPDEEFFKLADEDYRKEVIKNNIKIVAEITQNVIDKLEKSISLNAGGTNIEYHNK